MILLAAALSSMAGVYFEKILKGVKVSLWTRNLQLAAYSVITSFVPLVVSGEMYVIQEKGFFHGYTNMTWVCIIMNAGGGLLVGTVIKYGPCGDPQAGAHRRTTPTHQALLPPYNTSNRHNLDTHQRTP